MGVPRQRKTRSAAGQNKSHLALKKFHPAKCKNCGKPVRPHAVCANCGFYRGRAVIEIKTVKPQKAAR